jgi:hypothetical protein
MSDPYDLSGLLDDIFVMMLAALVLFVTLIVISIYLISVFDDKK